MIELVPCLRARQRRKGIGRLPMTNYEHLFSENVPGISDRARRNTSNLALPPLPPTDGPGRSPSSVISRGEPRDPKASCYGGINLQFALGRIEEICAVRPAQPACSASLQVHRRREAFDDQRFVRALQGAYAGPTTRELPE